MTDLSLKVVPDKLQRVVERVDGGELDLWARLLLSRTLHDSRQDLVRLRRENLGFLQETIEEICDQLKLQAPRAQTRPAPTARLGAEPRAGEGRGARRLSTHDGLADETESLEGVDPETGVLGVSDELEEDLDELWPVVVCELDDGDRRHHLGGDRPSSDDGRPKRAERLLLDVVPQSTVQRDPPVRDDALTGRILTGRRRRRRRRWSRGQREVSSGPRSNKLEGMLLIQSGEVWPSCYAPKATLCRPSPAGAGLGLRPSGELDEQERARWSARSSLHPAAPYCLPARQLRRRGLLKSGQTTSYANTRKSRKADTAEVWTYPCGECVLDGQTGRVSYVEPGLLARQLLDKRVHVPSLEQANRTAITQMDRNMSA